MVEPDVAERLIGNRGEDFGHAVDERLYSDETGLRTRFCLIDEMFAAAEPDFEEDLHDWVGIVGIKNSQVVHLAPEIERKAGQQRLEQRRLLRFELVPLAPAEKCALRSVVLGRDQRTARLRASARSVFSQENPPSFSQARPKCP